jgi:hypothetical protein
LNAANLGFIPFPVTDPLLAISAIKADLVVTGMSMKPGSELALTENAHFDKVPVVWISDYVMGSVFERNRDVIKTSPHICPEYLVVASTWVRNKELKNLPAGFDPDRVIVTGQPGFDRIAREDKEEIRKRVRKELGIADQVKLISYIGTALGEASPEALRVLVNGLVGADLKNYYLTIRRHQRDTIPAQEYIKVSNPLGERIIDTGNFSHDETVLASDLIVNTLSTTGMEAIYRGILVVYIWMEDIIRKSEEWSVASLPPVVEDDTAPAIFEESQAPEILRRMLTDEDYINLLRGRMARWSVDGLAAKRVANFILKLFRK